MKNVSSNCFESQVKNIVVSDAWTSVENAPQDTIIGGKHEAREKETRKERRIGIILSGVRVP